MDAAKNFAKTTVNGGYDDSATEIDLLLGDGLRFPAPPFNAVWWNASDYPDPADDPNVEVIRVTAIDTDTLTITRGQESTDPGDHNSEGKTYQLLAGLTAKVLNEDLAAFIYTAGTATINAADGVGISANGEVSIETGGGGILISASTMLKLFGQIGTDQSASGSTLGSVVKKIPIYDNGGSLLGYLPVYNSIT